MRTYSELQTIESFAERYEYLRLDGEVGRQTFGHERWMNQRFYASHEWKRIRDRVIARDLGCDLGVPNHEIVKQIHVHHINPIVRVDLHNFNEDVLNPEYLISASLQTHNAIHYGAEPPTHNIIVERTPGDTAPWTRRSDERRGNHRRDRNVYL